MVRNSVRIHLTLRELPESVPLVSPESAFFIGSINRKPSKDLGASLLPRSPHWNTNQQFEAAAHNDPSAHIRECLLSADSDSSVFGVGLLFDGCGLIFWAGGTPRFENVSGCPQFTSCPKNNYRIKHLRLDNYF